MKLNLTKICSYKTHVYYLYMHELDSLHKSALMDDSPYDCLLDAALTYLTLVEYIVAFLIYY